MRRILIFSAAVAGLLLLMAIILSVTLPERGKLMSSRTVPPPTQMAIRLPSPTLGSGTPVEKALKERRSTREYRKEPLSLEEIGQLLWSAQGITHGTMMRTAPSAGALYPLETWLVAGEVKGLPAGVYRYLPRTHHLVPVRMGDVRGELRGASLHQSPVGDAPASVVFSAVFSRTIGKYGRRGVRYAHMEAGMAAQNVALQAVSLHLGTVVIGAFDDDEVSRVLGLPTGEDPMIIMPVGK
jgi:SagB-type dehydrogenase family enzyme